MDISQKAQNTQDTAHRSYEAQEEEIPKCGYTDPSWKVDQHMDGLQPTNRLSIGSSMEQLEKGPKDLKRFSAPQEEQQVPTSIPTAPKD